MLSWIKAIPWLVAAIACAVAWFAVGALIDLRDEHTAYVAKTEQAAEDSKALFEAERKKGEKNLEQVRKDYEIKIPAIRDGAVRAYCLRNPTLCKPSTTVTDSAGQPVDDGAKPQCVAIDDGFIKNAAEDAGRVGAFQDYCKRNNCPIEE